MDMQLLLVNILALAVLVGCYMYLHRRKEIAVALVAVNIAVFALSLAMASLSVSAGLGLGLFGVLSIIRLRSTEISHIDVAYYFVSLASGLISGMLTQYNSLASALVILAVLSVIVTDIAQKITPYHSVHMTLDRALSSQEEISAYIAQRTGYHVQSVEIEYVDYVNDTTRVQVYYRGTAQKTQAIAVEKVQVS